MNKCFLDWRGHRKRKILALIACGREGGRVFFFLKFQFSGWKSKKTQHEDMPQVTVCSLQKTSQLRLLFFHLVGFVRLKCRLCASVMLLCFWKYVIFVFPQALGSFYFIHESLKNIQQFDFKGECPSDHRDTEGTCTHPSRCISWNGIFSRFPLIPPLKITPHATLCTLFPLPSELESIDWSGG